MKLTKLTIAQRVLSAIDSDNVNSIDETVESEQVGLIIDSVYDDINGDTPWAHLRSTGTLEVTTTSNMMKIPEGVLTMNDVYYNKEKVTYVEPEEMTELLFSRNTDDGNVDDDGAVTDEDPTYWTSYDDTYVIFDSYDSSLVSSLSWIDIYSMPAQMTEDTDYPDLPERFHNTIVTGATAYAFFTLKGDTIGFNIHNSKYRRDKIRMERWAKRVNRKKSTGYNVDYSRGC